MTNTPPGYTYEYPRPMVTVDAIIFRDSTRGREVLTIRRKGPPFAGALALPGGFVEMDEDLMDAAARELEEETGLTDVPLTQLGAFGKPGRDPRGRNIAIVFTGTVAMENSAVKAGDDAADAIWVPIDDLPKLAFDHSHILGCALKNEVTPDLD